jgi:phage repressor protein C with HTH and peptisase S24 domain
MRCSTFLDRLQNLTQLEIDINILENVSKVAKKIWYARMSRDGNVPDEEIRLFEKHFAIDLMGGANNNSTDLNYYPDVFASCGNGVMVFDDTSEKISVNKNTIPEYSETATYSVINARGFSMYPVISDNDKVIIKHWQGEQIIDDKIYLFDYKGELFIKRLVKNIDQVIAKSEDKTLEPRPMETSKLTILGRVISLIRTNL